jgi:hypothetical protein
MPTRWCDRDGPGGPCRSRVAAHEDGFAARDLPVPTTASGPVRRTLRNRPWGWTNVSMRLPAGRRVTDALPGAGAALVVDRSGARSGGDGWPRHVTAHTSSTCRIDEPHVIVTREARLTAVRRDARLPGMAKPELVAGALVSACGDAAILDDEAQGGDPQLCLAREAEELLDPGSASGRTTSWGGRPAGAPGWTSGAPGRHAACYPTADGRTVAPQSRRALAMADRSASAPTTDTSPDAGHVRPACHPRRLAWRARG